MKEGTVVGNVAKDLGLEKASLTDRRFRVVSGSKDAYFEVDPNNGALQIRKKIDREELCQGNGACLIELKILVENPLEIHYVVVEITDVNDHSPSFPEKEQTFQIAEHASPGTRFQLHAARDPDAGMNSIRTYTLTSNDHFEIEVSQSDEDKIPFLVLRKSLDREQKNKHILFVTAVDGGKPQRSGTLNVSIIVLDSNDNRPVFSQDTYQIEIYENVPVGTTVTRVNATDPDEGINGEIEYSLSKTLARKAYDIFELDSLTGHIKLKGALDFEETEIYKLDVEASDKGTPPLTGGCRVIIRIVDVNDNAPEIEVTSLSNTVSEDSKPGTIISLISVTDKDSGVNGKMISSITNDVPFELKPSYKENTYSIVTKGFLDREEVSHYEITIKASDCGEPALSAFKTLSIQISDVNDNSPQFPQNPLQFYIVENNVAGASIFSVSATDKDVNDNAAISYHIVRDGNQNDIMSFLNVNSDNGHISALKSFDFETLKTFQFQVVATDSGTPSLSSNVTVNVFILDQNDNPPVILYPVSSNGSAEGVEEIPRNVNAGHLVTKVRAYDADIGYNGWLLFSLQEVTDHSLFALDRYTGQIRTLRSFTETDEAEHKLVILVKDNGNVSLSATATVIVKVVEPKEAFAASDVKSTTKVDEEDNVTFYLMITLGSVSVLFLISIIVLIAMQCSKSTDYTSKYLQETNYDGTLCHSIQYRSGDKRYMLVGPRMSIGSTIVPGSHASTLVLPDRRRTSGENDNPPVILYPVSSNGSAEGVEEIPRNVNAGHLVTKVRAYDADIGYNGWLLFSLQEVTDHSLFALDRYTGQIRTLRSFTETDEAEHKLVILVKDNGNVSLSATATVIVKVVEPKEAFAASDVKSATKVDEEDNVTFYLMITLGSVSVLFLISIIVLIAMQCSKSTDYTSKYLQETNYDGTLCHSIQYRSGDKRYMLVGPRMSIGSTIVPGSHANTLVLPDRRRTSGENDNPPVILYPVSSNGSAEGVEEIPRNVNAGHLVTKVRAYDADIGYNGWLLFSLQEVTDHSLFALDRYTGQIRTLRSFTETDEAEHKLVILVKDNGNVSLSATATVIVKVVEPKEAFAASDVKSAAKVDEEDNVTFYLMITLGSVSVLFLISIIVLIAMQCSKSTDYTSKYLQEPNYDGTLCHSIQYRSGDKRYMLVGPRMSIGSTIVPGSHANTLVLPDRRRTSEEFQVVATDSGTPSLSSNVTVNVFILDQNDNPPVILYPVSSNGSAEGVEEIPRNVNAGHLVTKVRAYDADIGYNGWLLFSLQEVTDHSLFALDRYTGQIRTLRSFTERDEAEHKLVILVKDNGNVSLSATATVIVKVVEPKEAFAASDVKSVAKADEEDNVTVYLMITLGSVSVLFLISIIVLIAMQCSKSTDYTSKYLQETNYDGTLCHSIQYRSGDKRYMLVGPRMSIGSTIVPGSHANTLVLPDRRRTSEEV
ncbi:Protocadherin alpha-8, partial [Nibea albiflora]